MKLDRFHTSKLLAVAVAALIPVGAAQATDLYDSLKTLLQPSAEDQRITRDSPALTHPQDRQYRDRGARGPYRSDRDTTTLDQPAVEPTPSVQPEYIPSPPVTEERSP